MMRPTTETADPRQPLAHRLSSVLWAFPEKAATHQVRFWAFWLAMGGIGAASVFGFAVGWERLMGRWNDPYSYGHSYLVVPMAIWLMFVGLRGAVIDRIGPSLPGVFLVVLTVGLYAVSEVLDFTLGMQVAMPLLLLTAVFAVAGPQIARYAVIPVGMLYFAIPIWDHLVPHLQDLATWVVTAWLRWTGIIAHIDGHLITIRAGMLEIAEGCSGLRFVLVSLMLASFFAFSWLRLWRTRVVLLLVAGSVAMLANWIRIYTLVLIGDWSAMQHSLITGSHYAYGWIVFYSFMAPVLWFALWLESREPAGPRSVGSARVHRVAAPVHLIVVGVVVAAMVATPALLRGGGDIPSEPEQLLLTPKLEDGWRSVQPAGGWRPRYRSPHMEGHEGFLSPEGAQIDVYVARYLSQQPGSKLIAKMNTLNPGWQEVGRRTIEVFVDGGTRRVLATEISAAGSRRLVVSWYVVGGRATHHEMRAKLLEIPALLQGRRDGAVIAVSARCAIDCAGEEAILARFLGAYGAHFEVLGDCATPTRQLVDRGIAVFPMTAPMSILGADIPSLQPSPSGPDSCIDSGNT